LRAAELVREGALSVREIAETLGYDTPNYFSKSFKRIMGVTPSVYKKRAIRTGAKKMTKKMENGY
jgi:AraC-like DNA-binding protein